MIRFLGGLGLGAIAALIAYAITDNPGWVTVAGIFGALLVWAGPQAFDFLADVIDDL